MTLSAKFQTESIEVTAFDGKHLTLVSPRAFAPGYPLSVSVAFPLPATIELKSLGSKRRSDGSFDVHARPLTLRKDVRRKLTAHFAQVGDAAGERPASTSD